MGVPRTNRLDRLGGYRPMMSAERADQLRDWHERAIERGRRDTTTTVTHLGRTFVVPPDVYPPNANGLAGIVAREVRDTDTVLDLGTAAA